MTRQGVDSAVTGLAHTILGEHPVWGAFLDNLHVAHGLKRQGIGTRLLALTGQEGVDWSPSSGLYLWVLEQNSDARAFYAARGGTCVERAETSPPGGDAARLNGKPMGLRYAWRDHRNSFRAARSGRVRLTILARRTLGHLSFKQPRSGCPRAGMYPGSGVVACQATMPSAMLTDRRRRSGTSYQAAVMSCATERARWTAARAMSSDRPV
jgi:GNAT superfamily N-acetyltransferase